MAKRKSKESENDSAKPKIKKSKAKKSKAESIAEAEAGPAPSSPMEPLVFVPMPTPSLVRSIAAIAPLVLTPPPNTAPARMVVSLPSSPNENNLNLFSEITSNQSSENTNTEKSILNPVNQIQEIQKRDLNGWIEINVGGKVFFVKKEILCQSVHGESDHLLNLCFRYDESNIHVEKDQQGRIFFNRNSSHFQHLLEYLKTGCGELEYNALVLTRGTDQHRYQSIMEEASYFCMTALSNDLKNCVLRCQSGKFGWVEIVEKRFEFENPNFIPEFEYRKKFSTISKSVNELNKAIQWLHENNITPLSGKIHPSIPMDSFSVEKKKNGGSKTIIQNTVSAQFFDTACAPENFFSAFLHSFPISFDLGTKLLNNNMVEFVLECNWNRPTTSWTGFCFGLTSLTRFYAQKVEFTQENYLRNEFKKISDYGGISWTFPPCAIADSKGQFKPTSCSVQCHEGLFGIPTESKIPTIKVKITTIGIHYDRDENALCFYFNKVIIKKVVMKAPLSRKDLHYVCAISGNTRVSCVYTPFE